MNTPLRLKAEKVGSHALLHLLRSVLKNHPQLFEWQALDKGTAMDESHASFKFRDRTSEVPPFEVKVARSDDEFVALELTEDAPEAQDDAEYRQWLQLSFHLLYETAFNTEREEIGLLSYHA